MSSSGLVFPPGSSTRDGQLTAMSLMTPLPTVNEPLPCRRLPSHTTAALRVMSAIYVPTLHQAGASRRAQWYGHREMSRAPREFLPYEVKPECGVCSLSEVLLA